MTCPDCKHDAHLPGDCAFDNCGEAERIFSQAPPAETSGGLLALIRKAARELPAFEAPGKRRHYVRSQQAN